MQGIEISSPGKPDVLKLVTRPKPQAGPNEVLIEVHAAGVNRPDIVQRLGLYPPPPGASDLPGLEVSGVITEIGAHVASIRPDVSIGDSVCALVPGGGYAEFCVAPIETILPMPEGFSFIEAAAIPETFFTVWSNVFDRAGLQSGESLLVHGGSSGIGSTAIQIAKAFGVRVFTTVGSAEKAKFCRNLGADEVIEYRQNDFVEEVRAATGGKGVDVVLDMVGGDYIDKNISCLAVGGRHVSIAFLQGPKVEINMLPVMLKRLTLTGSTLRPRSNAFKEAVANALREKVWPLLSVGRVRPVIHSVYPLSDAAGAHTLMESSAHMGKIMLSVKE